MATQGCSYCGKPADYADEKGAPVCFDHFASAGADSPTEPEPAGDDWTALIPPMTVDQPEPLAVAPGILRRTLPPQATRQSMAQDAVQRERPHNDGEPVDYAGSFEVDPARAVLPYPGPPPQWDQVLKKAAEESNWQMARIRKLESILTAVGTLADMSDPVMLVAIAALAHSYEGPIEG